MFHEFGHKVKKRKQKTKHSCMFKFHWSVHFICMLTAEFEYFVCHLLFSGIGTGKGPKLLLLDVSDSHCVVRQTYVVLFPLCKKNKLLLLNNLQFMLFLIYLLFAGGEIQTSCSLSVTPFPPM